MRALGRNHLGINPGPVQSAPQATTRIIFVDHHKAIQKAQPIKVTFEVTNLLIPTLNDAEDETRQLCGWVAENLGPETPLPFSRVLPQNQLQHLPPTPGDMLD